MKIKTELEQIEGRIDFLTTKIAVCNTRAIASSDRLVRLYEKSWTDPTKIQQALEDSAFYSDIAMFLEEYRTLLQNRITKVPSNGDTADIIKFPIDVQP